MPAFELSPAAEADRPALDNLAQLYLYDFAEYMAGSPFAHPGDDGRFRAFFQLQDYWRAPGHAAFLVRVEGRTAGFALVNPLPRSRIAADFCISEFFVLRGYRRSGVGRFAAHSLFARFPGQWEVATMRRNTGASAFWRSTIREFAAASQARELDCRSQHWDGPVFRFVSRPGEVLEAARAPNLAEHLRGAAAASLDAQIRRAISPRRS